MTNLAKNVWKTRRWFFVRRSPENSDSLGKFKKSSALPPDKNYECIRHKVYTLYSQVTVSIAFIEDGGHKY